MALITQEHKNLTVLAASQALFMTSATILVLIGGLIGLELSAERALSTLPVAAVMIGNGLTMLPASYLMSRIGWRSGFIIGALIGVFGAGVAALGIAFSSFEIFVIGNLLIGGGAGFAQYYRFAAADLVKNEAKSIAISFVLAGGVVAAFLGPELAQWSNDVDYFTNFLESYLVIAVLNVIAVALLSILNIPRARFAVNQPKGRPLRFILCEPTFLVAVTVGMLGYGVTTLMMTATPLAMAAYGHALDHTAFVIQWHTVAMFAPAIATGWLIRRFGVGIIIIIGVLFLASCVIGSIMGTDLVQFSLGLAALGLGWNFTYIGATTLLVETYKPEEQAKTRAFNDILMFGSVAIASLVSGLILERYDWQMVNFLAIPFLVLIAVAIFWLSLFRPIKR